MPPMLGTIHRGRTGVGRGHTLLTEEAHTPRSGKRKMTSLLPRLPTLEGQPRSRYHSPTQIPANLNAQFIRLLSVAGNAKWACEQVGINKATMYERRRRDPAFARDWDLAVKQATEDRAAAILAGVDDHIVSHLRTQLVPLTDADGNPVVDEDFEPVYVSTISFRDLASMRRAVASEAAPPVQVNLSQTFGSDTVPRLERDVIDVDALIAELDADDR